MADLSIAIEILGKNLLSGPADLATASLGKITAAAGGLGTALAAPHTALQAFGGGLATIAQTALGFASGGGILAVPAALKSFTDAAVAGEAATARLNQAVVTTGGSLTTMGPQIDAAVSAAKALAFGGGDAKEALTILTNETGNSEEAIKRLSVAENFARGANIDLATASRLLGKVTDDSSSALGRYGIHVEKGTSATEVMGEVMKRFGGQAETFANSTAGAAAKLDIQLGVIKTTLGQAILPLMTTLGSITANVVAPAITSLVVPAFQALGVVAKRFADQANALLLPLFAKLQPLFQQVATFVRTQVATAFDFLGGVVQRVFQAVVQPAILAFVAFVQDKVTQVRPIFDRLVSGVQVALARLAPIFQVAQDAWGTVVQVFQRDWSPDAAINPLVNALGRGASFVRDVFLPALGGGLNWLQGAFSSGLQTVGATIGTWATAAQGALQGFVTFVLEHVPGAGGAFETLKGIVGPALSGISALLQGDVQGAIDAFGKSWDRVTTDVFPSFVAAWDNLKKKVEEAAPGITAAIGNIGTAAVDNKEAIAGFAVGLGALGVGLQTASGIKDLSEAIKSSQVSNLILGLGVAVAILATAWVQNWGDIQGKTAEVAPQLQSFAATLWDLSGAITSNQAAVAGLAGFVTTLASIAVVARVVAVVTPFVVGFATALGELGAAFALIGGAGSLAEVVAGIGLLVPGLNLAVAAAIAVSAAVGVLAAAWVGNWGDIQGKTAAVVDFLAGVPGAIGGFFDQVGAAAGGMVVAVGGFFSQLGTDIQAALAATGQLISTGWQAALGVGAALVQGFQTTVKGIWDQIPADIQADLILISSTLVARFGEMLASISAWVTSTVAALTGWATSVGDQAKVAITNLVVPVLAGIVDVQTRFEAWRTDVIAGLTGWATDVSDRAKVAIANLVTPVLAGLADVITKIGTWASDFLKPISGLATTAQAEAGKIGQGILDGIINMVTGGAGLLQNAMWNLVRGGLDYLKKLLGIASPSKLTGDEIGTPMVEGIIDRIVAGTGALRSAVAAIVNNAILQGIDPLIALALAKAESGLDPNAGNFKGESSIGLFQLNQAGGQGAGFSREQLSDPQFNASKFLAAHAALYKQLVAEGLAGDQLAETFGRLAEVSDPQYAYRYSQAYRELVAQFGASGPAINTVAQGQTALGAVQAQQIPFADRLAAAQAKLTQTLSSQADPMRLTTDAMKDFGANLLPIENQVANGAISLNTLQFKMIDLARATGLATEPWQRFSDGTISADQAMEQVINSAADAGPQFDALRKYFDTAGSSSREAALQFLQLALNYKTATPAIDATATATGAAADQTGQATDAVSDLTGKYTALSPVIGAATDMVKEFQKSIDAMDPSRIDDIGGAFDNTAGKIKDATDRLKDFINELQNAPSGGSLPGFAAGGTFSRGGAALTGELGPEIATWPAGTHFTPNNQIGGMLGGGGDTYYITVTVPGLLGTVEQATEAIHSGLLRKRRRNGPLGLA